MNKLNFITYFIFLKLHNNSFKQYKIYKTKANGYFEYLRTVGNTFYHRIYFDCGIKVENY
jgi:hypothetical protein